MGVGGGRAEGDGAKVFTNLFTSEPVLGDGAFIWGNFPVLSEDQSGEFDKEYSMEEAWKTLKGIGSLKVPGPDGFQACFFQKTWLLNGPALFDVVKTMLKKAEMNLGSNELLLVFIPNEQKPSSISDFRPISLCNVCVKFATR